LEGDSGCRISSAPKKYNSPERGKTPVMVEKRSSRTLKDCGARQRGGEWSFLESHQIRENNKSEYLDATERLAAGKNVRVKIEKIDLRGM